MSEFDAVTKAVLIAVTQNASSTEQATAALLAAVKILREDASMANRARSRDMALMPMTYA